MNEFEREEIKTAFNDWEDPVRILIGTDAASEGQNLQETVRFVLHFDIPWNPSRLDQRNGRLDRHGQARDVIVHHFTSEGDADIRFLSKIMSKVENIRTDLGSMSDLFDAAFQRRFKKLEDADLVDQMLESDIKKKLNKATLPTTEVTGEEEQKALEWLAKEVDFNANTLHDTLEIALGIGLSLPRLEGPDDLGRHRLKVPIPPRWGNVSDA